MACIDCKACHLESRSEYDRYTGITTTKNVYKCWGVSEPFVINNVNANKCAAYPEKKPWLDTLRKESKGEFTLDKKLKDLKTGDTVYWVTNTGGTSLLPVIKPLTVDTKSYVANAKESCTIITFQEVNWHIKLINDSLASNVLVITSKVVADLYVNVIITYLMNTLPDISNHYNDNEV